MLVDRMCMQSADTDTTQHAEPTGLRLTWLRTSCFCSTVGTVKRRGKRKEERVRKEWVEEEKGLATLCEATSSMVVVRLQARLTGSLFNRDCLVHTVLHSPKHAQS